MSIGNVSTDDINNHRERRERKRKEKYIMSSVEIERKERESILNVKYPIITYSMCEKGNNQ